MPKKSVDMIHIMCPSRAYLAPAKVMGPIVHPLKVAKTVAVQLLMSGAEVYEYVPASKETIRLTLGNINDDSRYNSLKEPTAEEIPVEPVKQAGVPVVEEPAPVVEPVAEPVVEVVEEVVSATIDNGEDDVVGGLVFSYNEDGTVDESTIVWSKYSKSQKKAIRARINEYNASLNA